MKIVRFKLPALLLGATMLLLSCAEPVPTGPVARPAAPQATLIGSLVGTVNAVADGLLTCSPLPSYSVTQTIGPAGGVLTVGPHTLTVPAGALSRRVTITATAPSGTVNRVHFEPAGLEFQSTASLTMSYANCNVLGSLVPKHIAYTTDELEILYYLLGIDDLLAQKVTGQLHHFSEYAMAW